MSPPSEAHGIPQSMALGTGTHFTAEDCGEPLTVGPTGSLQPDRVVQWPVAGTARCQLGNDALQWWSSDLQGAVCTASVIIAVRCPPHA